MGNRISRVSAVGYNGTKVEPIRAYTESERFAKLQKNERIIAEREEIDRYLAQFPNPKHLSFQELLENAMNPQENYDDGDGVIVDIKGLL